MTFHDIETGVTQLEEAGSAGILPAPLLPIADAVERSLSTGSGGRFSTIGRYLCPQLRYSMKILRHWESGRAQGGKEQVSREKAGDTKEGRS
jgi:hypothetical protein